MPFKFEKLEVWHLAVEYVDLMYRVAEQLPRSEDFNLKSQMIRAATSIALNVAEGSTSQSDPEQARFLSMAIRSLLETVACQHLIRKRNLVATLGLLDEAYRRAETLAAKLHAFRQSLTGQPAIVREESAVYDVENPLPG